MAFDGSTAITRATCGASARANAPVPAPTSATVLVAPTPSASSAATSSLQSVDSFRLYTGARDYHSGSFTAARLTSTVTTLPGAGVGTVRHPHTTVSRPGCERVSPFGGDATVGAFSRSRSRVLPLPRGQGFLRTTLPEGVSTYHKPPLRFRACPLAVPAFVSAT